MMGMSKSVIVCNRDDRYSFISTSWRWLQVAEGYLDRDQAWVRLEWSLSAIADIKFLIRWSHRRRLPSPEVLRSKRFRCSF